MKSNNAGIGWMDWTNNNILFICYYDGSIQAWEYSIKETFKE